MGPAKGESPENPEQALRIRANAAFSAPLQRMGGRVVECARLESVLGLKAHEGSNPSPSATSCMRQTIRFFGVRSKPEWAGAWAARRIPTDPMDYGIGSILTAPAASLLKKHPRPAAGEEP